MVASVRERCCAEACAPPQQGARPGRGQRPPPPMTDGRRPRPSRVAVRVAYRPYPSHARVRFFNTCVKLAGDDRDIDLYHWSSERFSSAWINTIPVLLAKGQARVSL